MPAVTRVEPFRTMWLLKVINSIASCGPGWRLALARLRLISLRIKCECGRGFVAEDLEPECPYCGRRYLVEVEGSGKSFEVSIVEKGYRKSFSRIAALGDMT